jgi:hypothetical protein
VPYPMLPLTVNSSALRRAVVRTAFLVQLAEAGPLQGCGEDKHSSTCVMSTDGEELGAVTF